MTTKALTTRVVLHAHEAPWAEPFCEPVGWKASGIQKASYVYTSHTTTINHSISILARFIFWTVINCNEQNKIKITMSLKYIYPKCLLNVRKQSLFNALLDTSESLNTNWNTIKLSVKAGNYSISSHICPEITQCLTHAYALFPPSYRVQTPCNKNTFKNLPWSHVWQTQLLLSQCHSSVTVSHFQAITFRELVFFFTTPKDHFYAIWAFSFVPDTVDWSSNMIVFSSIDSIT